ncbi:MAG: hypothetical protein IT374_00100 [Polyangiaceae bacterium]|nr:hypothetical protein [Polyangiaceae bacterium]
MRSLPTLFCLGAAALLGACVTGGPSIREDDPETSDAGAGGAAAAGAGGQPTSAGAGGATSGAAGQPTSGAAGASGSKAGAAGQSQAGAGQGGKSGAAGQSQAGAAGQSQAGAAGQSQAGAAGQGGSSSQAACDAAIAGLAADFEASKQGFTSVILDGVSASWPLDEWEWGAPSAGPPGCHGGAKCWGTNLSGNYAACGRAALRSAVYDLSACAGQAVTLAFAHWHAFLDYTQGGQSYSDGGVVEISGDGGQSWTNVSPGPGVVSINPAIGGAQCLKPNNFHVDGLTGVTGVSSGWVEVKITVPPALLTAKTQVRFAYGTGVNYNSTSAATTQAHKLPGWYIDDVALTRP